MQKCKGFILAVYISTAFLFIAFANTNTQAVTFTVNQSGDAGDGTCDATCTLRDAIVNANNSASDDTINFAAGLTTITLTSEIVIQNNGSLTINGLGANVLTIDAGAGPWRIFYIDGATVTITDVTLTGGNGSGSIVSGSGGAIWVNVGSLNLDRVHITGNTTGTNNFYGGGVFINAGGNHAIRNSTFSANDGVGGAIHIRNSTLTVANTTISGNSSSSSFEGGGGLNAHQGNITLRNVTISGNTSTGTGGGIYLTGTGSMNFGNTIIAGNTATGGRPELFLNTSFITVTSAGNNLIGDSAGDAADTNNPITYQGTDILDMLPNLGTLQNNGGTTPTLALLTGSPAINNGSNTLAVDPFDSSALAFDQRGTGFPRISNSTVDIGAYELTPTCISVSVPNNLQALRNTTLTVPINVTDTTNNGVLSFDFTLTYDPAVLTPSTTPFDTNGTLSNGYNITVNSSTPGTLVVSGFGTTDLTGAGVLLNLKFDVIGSAPSTSNLNFSSFSFNEGTPCAATTNGMFQVINGTISGAVTYGSSMTTPAVPNVTMTATGSPNVTGTTNSSGAYSLSGFGNGAYTVTPSKTGDVNNSITAFDAAKVAQHVVGTSTLTANQQIAADVSNNGSISSFDAALISRYVVSLPNSGNTGTWKFVPVNRSYANVEANHPNQDYTAILMGEVSGNWTPPSSFAEKQVSIKGMSISSIGGIGVSLPDQTTQPNSNVTVPINVQDTTGMNVISYEFDLSYDPSVLQLQASPVDATGTLSNGMSLTINTTTAGLLRVAAFGSNPISGAGILLNLKFTAIGSVGSISPLTWQRFMFNENDPQSATVNGQVRIAAPTAASVSVGGKVTTVNGTGLANARVTLTDENGETRTVTTNPFGYYRFTDVPIGETYIFSVSHKRYSFSSQILTIMEETNNLNFVASDFW